MFPQWTRNRIFGTSLSGSFWILLCMALLIVFSQPPLALQVGFQIAAFGLMTRLYSLRLEWILLLTEKDVPKFFSQSRNYPVILFFHANIQPFIQVLSCPAIFNHLFGSCICFHWPNLRKSFKLYYPNRFHVIYFSS